MLGELCAELKNYFLRDADEDIHAGTFTISGGRIESLPFLKNGQYFRIVGSALNDDVYQYPPTLLTDEVLKQPLVLCVAILKESLCPKA